MIIIQKYVLRFFPVEFSHYFLVLFESERVFLKKFQKKGERRLKNEY